MSSPGPADKLHVEVVGKTESLWKGRSSYVAVPAVDGSLGILPGRQPILTVLSAGTVEISRTDGDDVLVDIDGGFASVDQDFVTVVVENGSLPA